MSAAIVNFPCEVCDGATHEIEADAFRCVHCGARRSTLTEPDPRPGPTAQQRRVAYWLAHMWDAEADAIVYAYPRPEGWEALLEPLEDARDAAFAIATEGLAEEESEAGWRAALEAWGLPC